MNRNSAQSVAMLVGVVFVAVGTLGLVPAVTTHYDSMSLAGRGSGSKLLGLFQLSILLDAFHILVGVAGVALANTVAGARRYLIGGGIVCLGVWALGIVNGGTWIPVNAADDWLHLGFGASLIGLGFATSRSI
jgi:hypothetical protein